MSDEKKNWLGPYIPQGNMLREVVQQVKLLYYLMTDRRVNFFAKLIPVAAIGLIVSPVNIIPESIPVLGQLDTAAILMLGMRLFFEVAPQAVVREHLERMAKPIPDAEWHAAFHPPADGPSAPPNAAPSASEDVIEGSFRVVDEIDRPDSQR